MNGWALGLWTCFQFRLALKKLRFCLESRLNEVKQVQLCSITMHPCLSLDASNTYSFIHPTQTSPPPLINLSSLLLDFDEKCSQEDDWDVDMSVYYDHGNCCYCTISQEFFL